MIEIILYLLIPAFSLFCLGFLYGQEHPTNAQRDKYIAQGIAVSKFDNAVADICDGMIGEIPCHDPVASAYVRRIRNECDGLVEYLRSRGDAVSADKGDRVAARIYKPLRQVDGIVNGFEGE